MYTGHCVRYESQCLAYWTKCPALYESKFFSFTKLIHNRWCYDSYTGHFVRYAEFWCTNVVYANQKCLAKKCPVCETSKLTFRTADVLCTGIYCICIFKFFDFNPLLKHCNVCCSMLVQYSYRFYSRDFGTFCYLN